jgi:integrase
MSVYRPRFKDPKTGEWKRSEVYWYNFIFAGRRIRESAKTTKKTIAKLAEDARRRELEIGFNDIRDHREDRIRPIQEIADEYLEDYKLRHKAFPFAQYAVGHVVRHLGRRMAVDVAERVVKDYQSVRLNEGASAKTINEEVGFLLRLLGDQGDRLRTTLRRQKALKLPTKRRVGKAFRSGERERLLEAAKAARSPAIYPALMLALNAGMRDSEIRGLQWGRVDLLKAYLVIGESKTEAGEDRTIPLNTALVAVLVEYSKWYTNRFGTIEVDWYVFPFGKPRPQDPTRPMVTLKTAWKNAKTRANVKGRWHDNRHTFITGLAESGEAGDETIRDIAGHVSKRMLKHYSHIGMEAKRRAVQALVQKNRATENPTPQDADGNNMNQPNAEMNVKDSAKVQVMN